MAVSYIQIKRDIESALDKQGNPVTNKIINIGVCVHFSTEAAFTDAALDSHMQLFHNCKRVPHGVKAIDGKRVNLSENKCFYKYATAAERKILRESASLPFSWYEGSDTPEKFSAACLMSTLDKAIESHSELSILFRKIAKEQNWEIV